MSAKAIQPTKTVSALALAASKGGLSTAELESVKAWLAEQFFGNMFAKLGQGGHVEGEIALRRVFVDLPAKWRGQVRKTAKGAKKEAQPRTRFLQHFMAATPIAPQDEMQVATAFDAEIIIAPADCEIDAQMTIESALVSGEQVVTGGIEKHGTLAACLLVGGPGQGKSTLTQLACQLHRVALLNPFANGLTVRHQEALASFNAPLLAKPKESGALLPATQPCLPLQVSLPELAVWLVQQGASSEAVPAILNFVTTRPSAKRARLVPETLLALAGHLPILLVLDGFDEVGASDDRARLVHAARELLAVLAGCNAKVQVLVTTRPQGYLGEMQHIGVPLLTCQLELLEPDEAIHYAQRLLAEKIPGVDEQEVMLARLKTAATEAATQRLMTTPLQVTILAALVQQSGRAPRERWNLFHRYFTYTYNREVERNTYASSLLSEHRHHIEMIHTRVALLLQVESENNGGAAARISAQRLAEIGHAVLQQDGVGKEERDALVEEITMAAQQRLVFLVEPEPGFFGFEIRSLQEFMAAWALTSEAREKDVEARLLAISKSAIYRNVLLFAASRLFCDASPLRDVFADTICPALDAAAGDVLARLTCAGSLLALEILEEGSVLAQPKRAKVLFERACNLLTSPLNIEPKRLIQLTNSDTLPTLQTTLETQLGHAGLYQRNAWLCVLVGISNQKDWALALGERFWSRFSNLSSLVDGCNFFGLALGKWLCKKIEQDAVRFSPDEFIHAIWLFQYTSGYKGYVFWLISIFNKKAHTRIHFLFSIRTTEVVVDLPEPNGAPFLLSWQPWIMVARFVQKPAASSLADALDEIAKNLPKEKWCILQAKVSWPLATCLASANTSADLKCYAQQARNGELGDWGDWLAIEGRVETELRETVGKAPKKFPYPAPYQRMIDKQSPTAVETVSTVTALAKQFDDLRFIGNGAAGAQILAALSQKKPNILRATNIAKNIFSATQFHAFVEKLLTSDGLSMDNKADAVGVVRVWLGAQKTTLATTETWDNLKLPQPYPQQATIVTQSAYELPTAPIHLTRLDFKNIGILQKLDLSLQAPAAGLGQWLIILGQNGVGKTTLLRSLALGLRDAQNLGIWPAGVFSKNWVTGMDSQTDQPHQTSEAFITLTMANGAEYKTTIRQNGSTTVRQDVSPEPANRFPVFAYGCRRGSALSGGAREVNLDETDGPEIATLFNDDANLIHAETWLMKLIVAEQAEQEKPIFTAVVEALKTFLDIRHIEVRADGKAWVTEHDGLVSTLENLSDGYLTSAGWFLDMIARWIELTRRNKKPIEADFMRHMNGLVLIDEIDLHLHPCWQIDIISRTRKLLPNMSFIVTTHNPLTLVGAKANEIRILVRENGRVVAKTGEETPMLLTGGQLYDRYFGIDDIFPAGLGKDLHRYSFLAGYAMRSDLEQAELETLQARLAKADIRPDWDIVPRRLPAPAVTVASPAAGKATPAKTRSRKAKVA